MFVVANYYPDTYVYNWGDLVWQDESNNNTSLLLTNTLINATTFNSTVDKQASINDHLDHSFFDGYQLSSRALVQNLPLLNGLYVGVLVTISLHAGLFYWQMLWKSFKDNDWKVKEKKNEEEEEEIEMKEEEEKTELKEKGQEHLQHQIPPDSLTFNFVFTCVAWWRIEPRLQKTWSCIFLLLQIWPQLKACQV